MTTLSRHYGFFTSLLSFSLMTHPQINPISLHSPITITDEGTHPQTPSNLCQEKLPSSKCWRLAPSSGGSRAPSPHPQPHPCPSAAALPPRARRFPVRAGDRWQEAGKDPVEQRRPQATEPSCHLLSVPIRRAFSLTGYFICVYLSVCLCLALSSDVSVSQPSDVPSAAAGISEDRRNWHLSPRGWAYTCSGHRVLLLLWELVHTP